MTPLSFHEDLSQFPVEKKARHEMLACLFGQFLFWLRNSSVNSSRNLVESEPLRKKIGTLRSQAYEAIAQLPKEQQEASILLAEETLNGFLERLLYMLGDEGTDARLGSKHAYRFRIELEIVDIVTGEIVEEEVINRGGRFFGSYWGRWLNQYSSKPNK